MNQRKYSNPDLPKPHSAWVIFGVAAIEAYEGGIQDVETLKCLGRVKEYRFHSLPELNAFLHGIQEANGHYEMMAVEKL